MADKAAALLVGLSRNHPFLDGNKRTAIGAVNVFLRANGSRLGFDSDDEVADFLESVAQGAVQHEFIGAWLTAHMEHLP